MEKLKAYALSGMTGCCMMAHSDIQDATNASGQYPPLGHYNPRHDTDIGAENDSMSLKCGRCSPSPYPSSCDISVPKSIKRLIEEKEVIAKQKENAINELNLKVEELHKTESQNAILMLKIASLEEELENSKLDLDLNLDEKSKIKSLLEDTTHQLQLLEEERDSIKIELDGVSNEYESIKRDLITSKTAAENFSNKADELENFNLTIKENFERLEDDFNKLRAYKEKELEQKTTIVKEQETELESARNDLVFLKANKFKIDAYEELKNTHKEVKEENAKRMELAKQKLDYLNANQHKISHYDQLEAMHNELKEDARNSLKLKLELEVRYKAIFEELKVINEQNKKTKEELFMKEEELNRARIRNESSKKASSSLQTEIEKLKVQNKRLEAQVKSLEFYHKLEKELCAKKDATLEEANNRYALLLSHNNHEQKIKHAIKWKEDMKMLQKMNEELSRENAKMKRKIEQFEQQRQFSS